MVILGVTFKVSTGIELGNMKKIVFRKKQKNCIKSRDDIILYLIFKSVTLLVMKLYHHQVGGQNFEWFSCFCNHTSFVHLQNVICHLKVLSNVSNYPTSLLSVSKTQKPMKNMLQVDFTDEKLRTKNHRCSPAYDVINTLCQ